MCCIHVGLFVSKSFDNLFFDCLFFRILLLVLFGSFILVLEMKNEKSLNENLIKKLNDIVLSLDYILICRVYQF